MTLEQLRALCAIVDEGGFRAAAGTLHRSQSTISIAIAKLEDEIGVSLFSRDSYRPKLTASGRSLYEKATAVLSKAGEFTNLAHHYSVGEEPELRLAISTLVPFDRWVAADPCRCWAGFGPVPRTAAPRSEASR